MNQTTSFANNWDPLRGRPSIVAKPRNPENFPFINSVCGGDLQLVKEYYEKNGKECLFEQDEEGFTALHWSCSLNFANIALFLLEMGAAPDHDKNILMQTPLHVTCAKGNVLFALELVKYGGKDMILKLDREGYNVLHYIINEGNQLLFYLLHTEQTQLTSVLDNQKRSLLHWAVALSQNGIVSYLIKNGINIEVIDDNHQTAFHYSAIMGNFEGVKLILENGGNFNCVIKMEKLQLNIQNNIIIILFLMHCHLLDNMVLKL